jgi:GNAT superfamily N-acetyltransferase
MDVVRYLEQDWDNPDNAWLHNPEEIEKFRKDHAENEAKALEYMQKKHGTKTASAQPVLVYHGTRKDFDEFEPQHPRGAPGNPKGVYFTTDRRVAEQHAEDVDGALDEKSRVISAYLNLQSEADGVIKESPYRGIEYIVFNPAAIQVVDDGRAKIAAAPTQDQSFMSQPGDITENPAFMSWFKGSKVVDDHGRPLRVYHGTGADIKEFSYEFTGQGNDQLGSGFYFTNNKDTASGYATSRNQSDAGNVMPVYLAIKKPIYFTNDKASAPDLTTALVRRIIMASPELDDALTNFGDVDSEGKNAVINQAVSLYGNADIMYQLFTLANDFYRHSVKEFNEAVRKAAGYDGIIAEVGDETHYVAWFPNQIKSAIGNSKFDPKSMSVTAAMQPVMIPMDKIVPAGEDQDERIIAHVAQSMAKEGLREPITVIDYGDGAYYIEDGHHRYFAAKKLGWSEIPAEVIQMKTGADEPSAPIELSERDISPEQSSFEGTSLPGVRIEAGIDGENVGTIEIMLGDEVKRGRGYKVAFVRGILVAKHYQGQGIGQKLYDRAIQIAKARGCVRFYSDTASCMSKDAYKAWARLRTRYKIYFDDKMSRHVIDLNKTKVAGRKPMTKIPQELEPLAAEARKCDTFEEFKKDFSHDIKHGDYWHVTTDPNFFIDPEKGPRDMSSMADNQMTKGALMVTSHLEHWDGYYNFDHDDNRSNSRPYAALIDFSQVPRENYGQVGRGFGNEFWVENPAGARVVKVMPIDEALAYARHYGDVLDEYINSDNDLRKFWELATGKTSDRTPKPPMERCGTCQCPTPAHNPDGSCRNAAECGCTGLTKGKTSAVSPEQMVQWA